MSKPEFKPLANYQRYSETEMRARAAVFLAEMKRRRSVRQFSSQSVPKVVIEDCLRTAGTAPSGANQQPWHFVVVSDPVLKQRIRVAAEAEEQAFYNRRATPEWLAALEPLGTNAQKPFLETAPYLITVFVQRYGIMPDGSKVKHYYAHESVGIATGILIAALQHAGLATLTHTPSPMNFLNEILERPSNESPFLMLVVGFPAQDAQVPEITKKTVEEIVTFL